MPGAAVTSDLRVGEGYDLRLSFPVTSSHFSTRDVCSVLAGRQLCEEETRPVGGIPCATFWCAVVYSHFAVRCGVSHDMHVDEVHPDELTVTVCWVRSRCGAGAESLAAGAARCCQPGLRLRPGAAWCGLLA